MTLTRSSNHPCETQSALLCLGNSVEFVVKVVNVNLGIPDHSPYVLRARSLPVSLVPTLFGPSLPGGMHTRDAAAQMSGYVCKPSLVVRNTRFVLPLIPGMYVPPLRLITTPAKLQTRRKTAPAWLRPIAPTL